MAKGPKFDAVCFDCDSIEGIDQLARRSGCDAKIASLTEAAMNGAIPLEAVYAKRLDLVRPDERLLLGSQGAIPTKWSAERQRPSPC